MDRKAPCPCGSGKRYKSCCYARDRAAEAPRASARASVRLVDDVLKVFLPLVESRGEYRIACGPGCNACCNSFVRCSAPEALLIADWLRAPEHAAARARFEARYPAWRARAGDAPATLEALVARHGGAPADGADWERFNEVGVEYALRGNLCPFNDEGQCDIYPVRPLLCRSVYVLNTAEYCTPRRGGRPEIVSHPRLDEALQLAAAELARAAERMGRSPHERALPDLVAAALAELR